jgi:hypothetical protein
MFWITTVTAIVCALLFRVPAEIAIPIMLFISVAVLPAVWTTIIVYGRGYRRTFGIGAIFPSGAFLLVVLVAFNVPFPHWGSRSEDDFWLRFVIFAFWVSSLLVGVVCMGVRRLVERRQTLP